MRVAIVRAGLLRNRRGRIRRRLVVPVVRDRLPGPQLHRLHLRSGEQHLPRQQDRVLREQRRQLRVLRDAGLSIVCRRLVRLHAGLLFGDERRLLVLHRHERRR